MKRKLTNLNVVELDKIRNDLIHETFFFKSSLKVIVKHFLNGYLEVNVFNENYETILSDYIKQSERDDFFPESEEEFYTHVADLYLSLSIAPKDIILDLYIKASEDINSINQNLEYIAKEKNNLDREKISTKRLNVNKRYYLKQLDFYNSKNEEAKKEIVEFLSNDIKQYALNKAHPMNRILRQYSFNSPYQYAIPRFSSLYEPYDVRALNELSNKFLELPVRSHIEISDLYNTNKTEFYDFAENYINQVIIEKIENAVDKSYILHRRKDIINTLIKHYKDKDYISFVNIAPLQIEGLFHDCCLSLGIEESRLDTSSINEKLTIIDQHSSFLFFEYYSFKFPAIRNTVAHGLLIDNDLKHTSIMLLLDLLPVCEFTLSEDIPENKSMSKIKDIHESTSNESKYNLLMEWASLKDICINPFYKMEELHTSALNMLETNEFWDFLSTKFKACHVHQEPEIIAFVEELHGKSIAKNKCKEFFHSITTIRKEKSEKYTANLKALGFEKAFTNN